MVGYKSTASYKLEDQDAEIIFEDMVWVCCVGIEEIFRKEVPDAVATCQIAGIVVRIVAGDHLKTAKRIAKECGISICNEFRELLDEDKKEVLPRLRLLARS